MKAISLYQPWATLVAMGLKKYETRSWETFYRGPLLICASKKKLPFIEIASILMAAKLSKDDLVYGRAICVVELSDILKTDGLAVSHLERKFGDFSPGRYAWKLDNPKRFTYPPYVRGHQGIFDVPAYHDGIKI